MVTTAWIRQLIAEDELWRFYKTKEWMQLKQQVLEEQHHECGICKAKGIAKRYDMRDGEAKLIQTVHHIKEVRDYPELALSKDNLIPICKRCHNDVHGRTFKGRKAAVDPTAFTNEERW